MERCQLSQLDTSTDEEWARVDEKRVRPVAHKAREGRIDLTAADEL
jgi:hypothetical protein